MCCAGTDLINNSRSRQLPLPSKSLSSNKNAYQLVPSHSAGLSTKLILRCAVPSESPKLATLLHQPHLSPLSALVASEISSVLEVLEVIFVVELLIRPGQGTYTEVRQG